MKRLLAVCAALALAATGCGGGGPTAPRGDVLVVVSAPLTTSPWVADTVVRGARLAVEELNAAGGVKMRGKLQKLSLIILDHANNVQRAQANARSAVEQHAAALVTDGVGAVAVAGVAGPAHLPVFVTYEGGQGLVDEDARPTLFRMAPANKPMTQRLTDYIAGRKPRIALLTDDSGYGRDGRTDLLAAIRRDSLTLAKAVEVPTGANVAPQVLAAKQSGADTVLVWARAPVVASVISEMRSRGWNAAIYTGPTAEDPYVRQQLAQHPQWLDGTGFVSFRMTSEVGPDPFTKFRAAYDKKFGPDKVGVKAGGTDVVQPPDWAMYAYDSVQLLARALTLAKVTVGLEASQALIDALNTTSVTGANGDQRSFLPRNHEGVSSDDMYIARFKDMRFSPVHDDFLSASLPAVSQ
ncbi:MAG: branched-chain amino acid transport system substrate-binding protein [Frankiaceae bacterium]|nr:branched-chain amino acid transport system substrate-binding protein [Frankiaceae bacterium]